jgi:hypothetical protein
VSGIGQHVGRGSSQGNRSILAGIWYELRELSSSFVSFRVSVVRREENGVAHACAKIASISSPSLLGNSGKPVTLETLSLTKFSKYDFQEQGIRESRKHGTYEVSNSRMC